ncbi:MAG TPA: carboxypeptidase-like regulatory domain-containing protein [Longimicrobium sp.]
MRPFLVPLLISLSLPRAAAAQTVEGVLLAEDGETPLAGARLVLVGLGGRVAARALTDTAGRFTLTAADAGLYQVRAEPEQAPPILFTPMTLGAGERTSVHLVVQPLAADSPVALAPITATAERRRQLLDRNGFYQRQRIYPGRFLTREQFMDLHGFRLTQKIQDLGMGVETRGSGGFRLYRTYRGTRCYVAMYVDGAPVNDLSLNQLTLDMVAGVEYYTRDDIPPEWNPYKGDPNWRCGSLVIWTQPPDAPPGPPVSSSDVL